MRWILLGWGVLASLGCQIEPGLFECTSNAACVDQGREGICEPNGFCSFDDETCASGRRYGGLSPSMMADQCVPAIDDDAASTGQSEGTSTGGEEESSEAESGAESGSSGFGSGQGSGGQTTGPIDPSSGGESDPCALDPWALDCSPATRIAVGERHACLIADGDALFCWGDNEYGQRGSGTGQWALGDDEPLEGVEPVALGGRPLSVTAGRRHTCVLLDGGSIKCFGSNADGICGYPDHGSRLGDDEVPEDLPAVSVGFDAVQVAAGERHTCALSTGGEVRCWGDNRGGQLGLDGVEDVGDDEQPSDFAVHSFSDPVVQLSAGSAHTCVVLADGSSLCWGRNDLGELGLGNTADYHDVEPGLLPRLDVRGDVVEVQARDLGGCIRRSTGTVACWGAGHAANGYGEVTMIGSGTPPGDAELQLGANAVGLASSPTASHHCALLEGDALRCWGANAFGQLGLGPEFGTVGEHEHPEEVPVVDVAGLDVAVGRYNTCVRTESGAQCWGRGTWGVTGAGHSQPIFEASQAPVIAF